MVVFLNIMAAITAKNPPSLKLQWTGQLQHFSVSINHGFMKIPTKHTGPCNSLHATVIDLLPLLKAQPMPSSLTKLTYGFVHISPSINPLPLYLTTTTRCVDLVYNHQHQTPSSDDSTYLYLMIPWYRLKNYKLLYKSANIPPTTNTTPNMASPSQTRIAAWKTKFQPTSNSRTSPQMFLSIQKTPLLPPFPLSLQHGNIFLQKSATTHPDTDSRITVATLHDIHVQTTSKWIHYKPTHLTQYNAAMEDYDSVIKIVFV